MSGLGPSFVSDRIEAIDDEEEEQNRLEQTIQEVYKIIYFRHDLMTCKN